MRVPSQSAKQFLSRPKERWQIAVERPTAGLTRIVCKDSTQRLSVFGGRNDLDGVDLWRLRLNARQRGDCGLQARFVAVNVDRKREMGRGVSHERLDALRID